MHVEPISRQKHGQQATYTDVNTQGGPLKLGNSSAKISFARGIQKMPDFLFVGNF